MDLLEYIRKRNEMTREEWEDTFEKEEMEVLALTGEGGGAGKRNGFWEVGIDSLAYVNCRTNVLYKDAGRLVYPVGDTEHDKGGIFSLFKNKTIYRLKVRVKKYEVLPDGMARSSRNHLLVVGILEENASCMPLGKILTEYNKPIILQDEILGGLTLNKEFSWFEGSVSWQGEMIDISLEVDKDDGSSWTKARNAMRNMLLEQENWDEGMRGFAAEKLTALACEWRDSADEPVPEITEQGFSERIKLNSISMTSGGSFSAYFDDDDMFFGHCITVHGSLKGGIISADMEG
jgi:hypothetical protein